jgi:type IV secretory pathway VirB2 component (pilin)
MSATEVQALPRSNRSIVRMLPLVAIAMLVLLMPELAFAQKTGGDPWASSLSGLANMLNSTVARGIGTIALFAAGGMLVFGGELNEFTKKILMVVLAVAVMVLGSGMIAFLFP